MSPRSATTNASMRDTSRRAILDAAMTVFRTAGPQRATTAAIAAQAGVAKGLVFNYFASKDALLEAVIEDRLLAALRYWDDLPPLKGAALLTEVANRALDSAIAHADDYRLYFALFFEPGAPDAVRRLIARIKPQVEVYYRLVGTALRDAGSKEPAVDALLFQASLNGLVQNLVIQPDLARNPKLFPRKQLIARLVAAFAPGAGPRATTARRR